ncbi:bifunctional phosphoribosylaminoimidazolecarboxamide formyltransferase/IMP cyclohydrolase [Leptolyngbya sp. BL0902]|uniref:bifunctional phosphoribosylaminoimidazolecarboxamide formyltransferase/IMP cyclohydrolase n=1 Tax=Leptolyngbya sp. BL0902 TaxID=1115757 RepID=UPI0018E7DD7E|nr:bifunctional phosphoribosylaminoimidazolecarboxamide formyltransferase/IMP cyclohydrolase [Leptolyngbya sp. BL0902]
MARLALLSVSDKTGLVELAQALVNEFGFEIVSSGGTARALAEAGLPVTKVSDYTGSPEILGGRVKTLHPRIHGGILARPDMAQDEADLAANNIRPFDLVVVNLYPFEQTIAKAGVTLPEAIEQIDIGGPTMVRAAAKNHAYLTILCQPNQYADYLEAMRANQGQVPLSFRQACAQAAFWHTANYDQAIATYLTQANSEGEGMPTQWAMIGQQHATLRYGENPHQSAAWYRTGATATGWAGAEQLQGKELSYNNLVDLEAARRIIAEFPDDQPAAAVLKHTNPCGVAMGDSLATAYQRAYDADSTSAFGGIVALNRVIDADTAQQLTGTFLECIVAPGCDAAAREILAKKQNLRVLVLEDLLTGPQQAAMAIAGGFLLQNPDTLRDDPATWQIVTEAKPTEADLSELLFAWRVVKHVKSNAIVVTNQHQTLGIGAGQMNRVGSVGIALTQAGDKAQGAILASDGFFPFDDSVRTAAAAGIRAIVQPGGSRKDDDSIKAANELGIIMALTGVRHFLH